MYAVIETGGKQYRVELGSEIEIATLSAEPGDTFEFERVLLVADGDETAIGQPLVENARVSGSIVRHDRGDKIVVFKYRPKARRRVKHGHRQDLTLVRISDIVLGGRSAAKAAEADRAEEDRARAEATRAAEKQAAADRALAQKLAREAEAEAEAAGTEEVGKAGRRAGARKPSAEAARAGEKPAKSSKASTTRSSSSKARTNETKAEKTPAPKSGAAGSGRSTRKVQAPEPTEKKTTTRGAVKPRSAGAKRQKDS